MSGSGPMIFIGCSTEMKKTALLLAIMFILCSCAKEQTFSVDTSAINAMDYVTEALGDDIHSAEYLVIDISDCDYVYSKDSDVRMYPASLTKLVTLDTVLSLADDLYDLSYVTYDQVEDLIREDASLAYIQRDYPYTLMDLLYALVLPSGADAAVALENYFSRKGISLVDEMNNRMLELGGTNSNFVNTTGLHDDGHYTCLDDLYLIVRDILKYKEGRQILNVLKYELEDGTMVHTTMGVAYREHNFSVLGGKTGYTPEAGQNIIALCKYRGRSYLVMFGNAYGNRRLNQYWHYDDVERVFEYLEEN